MKIRAEMERRHAPLWPHEYQVDKVVVLPNVAFASFMIQPLDRYDFIERNEVEPHQGTGLNHCLLLLSGDRTDGALVQCGGGGHGERRPEVAQVDIALQHIETTFRPEFCAQLQTAEAEKAPDIRVRDILPLLKGGGLAFLTHEEVETSVQAENLRELTDTGQKDHAALLNARVAEISPCLEGVEVVLTDVDPQELARFNQAYEDHQAAEQAMGGMTP